MNNRISEILVLLVYVTKWVILATITGIIVGLSTTGFLMGLEGVMSLVSLTTTFGLILLPLGLMASAWITSRLAPEAGGQGLERVIQAVHYRSGHIQAQVIPAKLIATLLTVGTGGSAGSVGPCAQIGGGLCSVFADLVKLDDSDRKTLVISGISAGFAAVLGTPLAAAIFGVEALFVGSMGYQVLLPSVISAMVSYQVAIHAGIPYWSLSLEAVPTLSFSIFPWLIGGGIVFGLCSILFIEGMDYGKEISMQMPTHPALNGLIAGSGISGIAFFLTPDVLGLGVNVIQETIQGHHVIWYLFLVKILVTSLTLNFGGSGGIILPICFVGTTVGAFFASIFSLPNDLFAILGLAGLLAGAINTPLTALLLSIELFGLSVGPFVLVICAISFLISGHRSALPTQVLTIHKAPAIRTVLQEEISKTKADIPPWSEQLKWYQEIFQRYSFGTKKPDAGKEQKSDSEDA